MQAGAKRILFASLQYLADYMSFYICTTGYSHTLIWDYPCVLSMTGAINKLGKLWCQGCAAHTKFQIQSIEKAHHPVLLNYMLLF